jgi:predicted DNA-binding transcriptional regulator AlpA
MREHKAYQRTKIEQIRQALNEDGISSLDQQTVALGLPRSTTWTIVAATHKSTGLSSKTIRRMLASQHLPPKVRAVLVEYVEQKIDGRFGYDKRAAKRFVARIDQMNI